MSISMIVSVDARYINYRCPANSNFRTTYMRRRTQLLRKYTGYHVEQNQPFDNAPADSGPVSEQFLQNYFDMRKKLLNQKYGTIRADKLVGSPSPFDGRHSRSDSVSSVNALPALEGKTHELQNDAAKNERFNSHPLFRAPASQQIQSVNMRNKSVRAVSVCRDGLKFACCSDDEDVLIVSLAVGNLLLTLKGHRSAVSDVQWLPNDQWLVSCSQDGSIRLWDGTNGHCIRVCRDPLNSSILCFAAFPLNGNILMSCNSKNILQMLNFSTGLYSKSRLKMSNTVNAIVFDDIGDIVLTGDKKGVLSVFRLEISTGKLTLTKQYRLVSSPMTSLSYITAVRHDGAVDRLILCSLAANTALLLKLTSGGGLTLYREFQVLHRHLAVKSCFSLCLGNVTNQNTVAVSGSEDGRLHIFDTANRGGSVIINEFQAHNCPVLAVACFEDPSSNRGFVVSGDQSGQITIWRFDT